MESEASGPIWSLASWSCAPPGTLADDWQADGACLNMAAADNATVMQRTYESDNWNGD